MAIPFLFSNWYWFVGADTTRVYSTKARAYVLVPDPTYQQWSILRKTLHVASEAELWAILINAYPDGLPLDGSASNAATDSEWDALPLGARKLLFYLFNQVRQLNGQAPVGLIAFRILYRALSAPS